MASKRTRMTGPEITAMAVAVAAVFAIIIWLGIDARRDATARVQQAEIERIADSIAAQIDSIPKAAVRSKKSRNSSKSKQPKKEAKPTYTRDHLSEDVNN